MNQALRVTSSAAASWVIKVRGGRMLQFSNRHPNFSQELQQIVANF